MEVKNHNPPMSRKLITAEVLSNMNLISFDLGQEIRNYIKNHEQKYMSKYQFSQMIRKWCVQNTSGTWFYMQRYKNYNIEYSELYFENASDAVAFKLVWL